MKAQRAQSAVFVDDEHVSANALPTDPDVEIAAVAYQLWEARGCPEGSDQEDWFNAINVIKERRESRLADW